jgi:hypothetical protein
MGRQSDVPSETAPERLPPKARGPGGLEGHAGREAGPTTKAGSSWEVSPAAKAGSA